MIQLRRILYSQTEQEIEDGKKLRAFPDDLMKIQHLDDEQWPFYAVPDILFGRLSEQLSEYYNEFILGHGMRHYSTLEMLNLFCQQNVMSFSIEN